jgi:DNA-binding response OmpR family regulator
MLSRELASDSPTTVLLVDDHQDIRTLTEIFLRQAGFHVEAVDTGEAAIEFLQKTQRTNVDLVITDLHLPGKCDGIALLAYHNRMCPEGGRILFTADFSEQLRVVCQQINAVYLPKPVRLPDLLLKIKDCLSAHSSLATSQANAPGSLSMEKELPQRGAALLTKLKEMSWRSYFERKPGR